MSKIITKKQLIKDLTKLAELSINWKDEVKPYISPEEAHYNADLLLLNYINDEEITKAFENIERWYE